MNSSLDLHSFVESSSLFTSFCDSWVSFSGISSEMQRLCVEKHLLLSIGEIEPMRTLSSSSMYAGTFFLYIRWGVGQGVGVVIRVQFKVDRWLGLVYRGNETPSVRSVISVIEGADISAICELWYDHKRPSRRNAQRFEYRGCVSPFFAVQPSNEQSFRITAAECDSSCHAPSSRNLHRYVPVSLAQGVCIRGDSVVRSQLNSSLKPDALAQRLLDCSSFLI